jgi:hypothetical protein
MHGHQRLPDLVWPLVFIDGDDVVNISTHADGLTAFGQATGRFQ